MTDQTLDKPKLQWQIAKPAEGFEKSVNNMLSSLTVLVTRQVKDMVKDLKKAKKLHES
jgi:hypothetical protein